MHDYQHGWKRSGANWRHLLINPVLNKEFRLRMRSKRAMWTLFFYLFAIGLLTFTAVYLTQVISGRSNSFNPDSGRMLFIFLSMAQMGLIAFMAPGLTAGIISGEREKQTLNLLLTTPQSSATIIMSKLAASLSFMVLVVLSTIPMYSIVFLYGGVSPKQLIFVFLYYLFLMLVLGSLGIMFSTLFKRTMLSVIVTYGVTLFLFAGTVVIYFLLQAFLQQSSVQYGAVSYWMGHVMALNPAAALYSLFEPTFSDSVYRSISWSGPSSVQSAPLQLWQLFLIVYTVLIALALWIAIRKLRPSLKRRR
ncbi:ABC transporter permease [Paenibacillus chungangensis]|uniref:ABC transporter permease n=1 Tax=Paenibacillus chungangensis TaxID=696535 RepID=A0ABW3HPY7_9BACL